MQKVIVKIMRDVAKNPSVVEILKDNRKVTVTFDPNVGMTVEGPQGSIPSIPELLQMAYPYTSPLVSRPAWYDRNPKPIAKSYMVDAGPHVATQRITYTVPPDRVCMVEMTALMMLRLTVAAPVGRAAIILKYTPLDQAQASIVYLEHYDNTPGFATQFITGSTLTLFSGDILRVDTGDTSTGGTISYKIGLKGTEFDA